MTNDYKKLYHLWQNVKQIIDKELDSLLKVNLVRVHPLLLKSSATLRLNTYQR